MDDCCNDKGCEIEALARTRGRRTVLMTVLALNAAMFPASSSERAEKNLRPQV